ncbi:MAG: hypothetical protein ACKVPX_10070 [Myxococcaceae bacterium]
MTIFRGLVLSLLFAAAPAVAGDDLSAEKLGRVQYEEDKARAKVDAEYKGRDLTKMNAADRKAYQAKQDAALRDVHQQQGVNEKDFARRSARMSPAENAAAKKAAREAQEADVRAQIQKEEEDKQAGRDVEVISKDEARRRIRSEGPVEVGGEEKKK